MNLFPDLFKKKEPVKMDDELVPTMDLSSLFGVDFNLAYNPDKISLDVYKKISRHYQVKAAIATIAFSLRQIRWFVKSDDKEVQDFVNEAISRIFNQLIKSVSKGLRYGFSPNVKVFTLEKWNGKDRIFYKKIKDLDPRYCTVRINKDGNFDGFVYKKNIKKIVVKPDYAFWYAHDMEDGNYYGESPLKTVYNPWFFSEKMHMFCNRYYERFGEPLVVGLSPNGASTKNPDTGQVRSAQAMMRDMIMQLRSHSSAQLPSDRDEQGHPLYDIKYLESQMRGFDFETYFARLDREIALGLLLPSLMFGGDKGGSYSLGASQMELFYTNLMGMMDDIVDYVNSYIIPQLVEYNFGKERSAKFSYQPLSVDSKKNIQEMIMQMLKNSEVELDIDQIESRSGIKMKKSSKAVKPSALPVTAKAGSQKKEKIK